MDLNRRLLLQILHDMEDFARMKGLECPPIFLLGGSGCIIGGYISRTTTDFDLLDLDYPASAGRLFKMLGEADYLDYCLTTIPNDFRDRALKLVEFTHLDIHVLSREDIIVSKIGRYSEKDVEDIKTMMTDQSKPAISKNIESVLQRDDISNRVKERFIENASKFRRDFHV